jgi:hypothetical protein
MQRGRKREMEVVVVVVVVEEEECREGGKDGEKEALSSVFNPCILQLKRC